jgi:predicted RND superfamily exporter protein
VPIIFFETSTQAEIVIPMAVSLAFGVLFATIVTLVLIPCLYIIIEDLRKLFSRKKKHEHLLPSNLDDAVKEITF